MPATNIMAENFIIQSQFLTRQKDYQSIGYEIPDHNMSYAPRSLSGDDYRLRF